MSDGRLERTLRMGRPGGGDGVDLATFAAEHGELDAAVSRMDTRIGGLLVAVTEAGLAGIEFLTLQDEDDGMADLAVRLGPRLLHDPRRTDAARRQLDEYLHGDRQRFEITVDLRGLTPFQRSVLDRTASIPYGATNTYAEVAAHIDRPGATRAVGNALGVNPVPIVIPCHRVLRTGGNLGGYAGGVKVKAALLALEGVITA